MSYLPPYERDVPDRRHEPRWTETALAEVVAVGTGASSGKVQVELYSHDGAAAQDGPIWARVAVPVAGGKRGAFLVPAVGDEVIVAFVGGDARFAVVLGSLWNGKDEAPESLSNGVDRWSFTSPSGTRVRVTETSASDSTVTIEVPDKATATFTASEGGKIELTAGGSTLVLDSTGIHLTTGGDYTVEAGTASLTASMADFDAPMCTFSGVTQAVVAQSDTVVGSIYTPGVGSLL